jgi:hypothetical protein
MDARSNLRIIVLLITISAVLITGCVPAKENIYIEPKSNTSKAATNPSPLLTNDNLPSTISTPRSKTLENGSVYLPKLTNKNSTPKITTNIQVTPSMGYKRIPLSGTLSREEIIKVAQEHIAHQLGVHLESIILVGSEPTEWNDLQLACSKPSPKYQNRALPRSIHGLRILLSVQGRTYEYHSSNEWMVFCGIAKSDLHEKIFLPPTLTY